MDFDKVREDINSILDTGDKVKASSKILDLQDYITQEQANDTNTLNDLNDKISNYEKEIETLKADNDSIRAANFDVMAKYGDLVKQTQPVLKKVETKEEEEKSTTWEDIMAME